MEEIPSPNQVLGNRYLLIRQVGKGGMAIVYKAYDQMLERAVAIKLLKQDFSDDEDFRERFKQEAKAAANLSHPNIVTVHDFGIDPSGVYIVMEYIAGKDLKSSICDRGFYPYREGLPLMIQACAGLGYAHRAGIVHCDVKPHNMLVTPDNRLKITDFGIARALSTIEIEETPGVVWGSPQYLSPEQAAGQTPTPASDVYSLGVVMYEFFTGHLPFEAETADELVQLHQSQMPVAPHRYVPGIPRELEQILLKVLSKEPAARYRTADQLGLVLSLLYEKPEAAEEPIILTETNPVATAPFPEAPAPNTYYATPAQVAHVPARKTPKTWVDWRLILLELLAILFVGGLIPFWLFILFKINTFLR